MRFVLLIAFSISIGCISDAHAYCETARSATELDLCARRYGGERMPWDYHPAPRQNGVRNWQQVCSFVWGAGQRMCHYEMR